MLNVFNWEMNIYKIAYFMALGKEQEFFSIPFLTDTWQIRESFKGIHFNLNIVNVYMDRAHPPNLFVFPLYGISSQWRLLAVSIFPSNMQ